LKGNGLRSFAKLVAVIAILVASLSPSFGDKRLALVIGNSAYTHAPKLQNPANDAADMAAVLRRIGFEVVHGVNLDFSGMRDVIRTFSLQMAGSNVALLFYAGHAVQIDGKNYLAPIDVQLDTIADIDLRTINLDVVLRTMEAEQRTNIVFLDACRDNPMARDLARRLGTRSLQDTRGLAQVAAPVGTLIAYATQPGNVAFDGAGRNSPFTSALLNTIEQPGLPLGEVMIAVRNDVLRSTNGKQVPWDHSSLTGQFFFVPASGSLTAGQPANLDIAFWNSIRGTRNPQLYEAYLRRYPDGAFAEIARIELSSVRSAAAQAIGPADKTTLSDPGLLKEMQDRLYELNFDPAAPDREGMRVAIREFERQLGMPQTGDPTSGLLRRLRELGGLKPWGAIVFDKTAGKWGMSWGHTSRQEAVRTARSHCAGKPCAIELSFFGTSCGAFAVSDKGGWSMAARDDVQHSRAAAVSDCERLGRSCRVVGTVCADGAGRFM
jgi:hypothetical protein